MQTFYRQQQEAQPPFDQRLGGPTLDLGSLLIHHVSDKPVPKATDGTTFRFPPGTSATQIPSIPQGSYPCIRVILVTPNVDYTVANTESIYLGIGGTVQSLLSAIEYPPGSSDTIEIDDAAKLWFLAENTTDIVFGRIES